MNFSPIDRPRQADPPPDHLPDPYDPPDVLAFAELAEARRRGDRSRLRELITELLGYGWAVFACEPRRAGRSVR